MEEREEGARKGGGGRGEKLASSPHASLNRPTRLVAKSHQSSGEEGGAGETREEEEDKRRQTSGEKEGELVSEVEVRSCWADAGGVMGGRK